MPKSLSTRWRIDALLRLKQCHCVTILLDELENHPRHAQRNDEHINFLLSNPKSFQDKIHMDRNEFNILYSLVKFDHDSNADEAAVCVTKALYSNYWRLFIVVSHLCSYQSYRSIAADWHVSHVSVEAWNKIWPPRIDMKLSQSPAKLVWFTPEEQRAWHRNSLTSERAFKSSIGIVDGIVIEVEKPRTDRDRSTLASQYKNVKKGWGMLFAVVCDRSGLFRFVSKGAPGAANEAALLTGTGGLLYDLDLLADKNFPVSNPMINRTFKRDEPTGYDKRKRISRYTRSRLTSHAGSLSSERSLIERRFGVMREVFGIFRGVWHSDWSAVQPHMKVCALISNVLLLLRRTWVSTGMPEWLTLSLEAKATQLEY